MHTPAYISSLRRLWGHGCPLQIPCERPFPTLGLASMASLALLAFAPSAQMFGAPAPQSEIIVNCLTNLNPSGDSQPKRLLAAGEDFTLFFAANDGTHGEELWSWNGASTAVSLVGDDVFPGLGSSNPTNLTDCGDFLYYTARTGTTYKLLSYAYRTNSTINRVVCQSAYQPTWLIRHSDDMLYFAWDGQNTNGVELWRANGTSASNVCDVIEGTTNSSPSWLTSFNGRVYFAALYSAGKRTVFGFEPSTGQKWQVLPGLSINFDPKELCICSERLVFSALSTNGIRRLWVSNGGTNDAIEVANRGGEYPPYADPRSLKTVGNTLYACADLTPNIPDAQLVVFSSLNSTGASYTPHKLNRFNDEFGGYEPANPRSFLPVTVANGETRVFFVAYDNEHGSEMTVFVHDTTASPPSALTLPWHMSDQTGAPRALTSFENTLYCLAADTNSLWQLVRAKVGDGATPYVFEYLTTTNWTGCSPDAGITPFNGDLYVGGISPSLGTELFRMTGNSRFARLGERFQNPNGDDSQWAPILQVGETAAAGACALVVTNASEQRSVLFVGPALNQGVVVKWTSGTGVNTITNEWTFLIRNEAYDTLSLKRLYHTEDASRAPRVDLSGVPFDTIVCSNLYVNGRTERIVDANTGSKVVSYGNIWVDEQYMLHADTVDERGNNAYGRNAVLYYQDGNGRYHGHEVVTFLNYHQDSEQDVAVGQRLGPVTPHGQTVANRMPQVVAGKMQSTDDEGLIYQHLDQGAYNGSIWCVERNEDPTAMEVFWMRDGTNNVVWPCEMTRYKADWNTNTAQRLVRRADSLEPRVSIPSEFNPHLMPAERLNESHRHGYLTGSEFYTDGAGFSLLKLETGPASRRDWLDFTVVRSVWNTETNTFSYDPVSARFGKGPLYSNRFAFAAWPIGDVITNAYHVGAKAGYICDRLGVPSRTRADRYHPGFYGEPDTCGMTTGRVFAVNTGPLEVWWSNLSHTNAAEHGVSGIGIQWPSYVAVYTNVWPSDALLASNRTAVIANRNGTGVIAYDDWGLYVQNDPALPGFNPNDEHAIVMPVASGAGTGVFPLRCDLWRPGDTDVSEPYLLVENLADPDLDVWRVVVTNAAWNLVATNTVGKTVEVPYPLEKGVQRICERSSAHNATNSALWRDRKRRFWARSTGTEPPVTDRVIRFHYNRLGDFYLPQWYTNDWVQQSHLPATNLNVGAELPWLDMLDTNAVPGTPVDFNYVLKWPDNPPELRLGQTLTTPVDGLPQIWNQRSVEMLYQQSCPTNPWSQTASANLFDPMLVRVVTNVEPEKVPITPDVIQKIEGKWTFVELPVHLQKRLTYDREAKELRFTGHRIAPAAGDAYLLLNVVSEPDRRILTNRDADVRGFLANKLDKYPDFCKYIGDLCNAASNVVRITDNTMPFANIALGTGGATSNGYVTLAFNNSTNLNDDGDPISLAVINVTTNLFAGKLQAVQSANPLDENLVLRHTADFGGEAGDYEFEWVYVDGTVPNVEPETWTMGQSASKLYSFNTNGPGVVELVVGTYPEFTLKDNWFACRYRPTRPSHPRYKASPSETDWSAWTPRCLSESWVKRVLNGITPYEQRVKAFDSYAPNLAFSMLEQIGAPFQGVVPLNPEAVDQAGLIQVYRTVLERALAMSYDGGERHNPGYDNTLLLAAGRLADLFMVLGNEAYADACDPTVGFGTENGSYGAEACSLFCFVNMLPSLLDEELALLRGRPITATTPPVSEAPYYNRLPWNLTGDVVGGEVAYLVNYEVTDVANADGERVADGFVNEMDAARLYPQGHGDAWGHYLSASQYYYRLLRLPSFRWTPRTENISISGSSLAVDYLDERKFAKAAAARTKAGGEIVDLTYRSTWLDDPDACADGYADSNTNRAWGVADWACRVGQGAYFDWVVANALLPTNTMATGLEKVDRSSVPELGELVAEAAELQRRVDLVDSNLNPLGLAAGTVPFDISPSGIDQGRTHFEQIYDRALQSLQNAQTVFNHAQSASQDLRRQFDSYEDFARNVEDREADFENRLIELYGYPYADDIGPGKTYPQGYTGPDYYHYDYVDTGELLGLITDTRATNVTLVVREVDAYGYQTETERTITMHYAVDRTFWAVKPKEWTRGRAAPGEIQFARGELIMAIGRYLRAEVEYDNVLREIDDQIFLLEEQYRVNAAELSILNDTLKTQEALNTRINRLRLAQAVLRKISTVAPALYNAVSEGVPKVWGIIAGTASGAIADPGAAVRAALKSTGVSMADVMTHAADVLGGVEQITSQQKEIASLDSNIRITATRQVLGIEQSVAQLQRLVRQEASARVGLYGEIETIQQSVGRYLAAVQKANRLEADRLRVRKQTAAQLQDYRLKDMTLRIFRNDALQRYRAQFDLAARYVNLAARAYHYETGDGWGLFDDIATLERSVVRARAIGFLADGQPNWSGFDGGLAAPMADLYWSWFVLGPQYGFENPQTETGRFSLRSECFRVLPGASGDTTWRELLRRCKVDNLLDVPEFQRFCIPFDPHLATEPALVIPFSTCVNFGMNYFGWQAASGDNAYDPTYFATKIRSVGVWLSNYANIGGGGLVNTPRVYLVPVGADYLRTPTGDRSDLNAFRVLDQVLPVLAPVSSADLADRSYIPALDNLVGTPVPIRRHGMMRAYHDAGVFDAAETINDSRLVGRSVWNTRWVLIIPAGSLLADRTEALERFIDGAKLANGTRDGNGVKDIKLFFQTYAYPGL